MTAPRLTSLYVSRPRLIERPYAGLARNLTLYFLPDRLSPFRSFRACHSQPR